MPLASILMPPSSQQEFQLWSQAHSSHHYDCIRVAGLQFNKSFTQYILDPFDPGDMEYWLDQHAQMHLEMDTVLNVQSNALTELDWKDADSVQSWFAQNFIEHQQWGVTLNLG